MSELVTVYSALPENASKIVQLLESRNLHPVVVDDVGKTGAYRSHQIRIAVPETERDMAVGILSEAERHNETQLSELINVTNGIILIVISVLVLVVIVGFFDNQGKWFFSAWMLITAIASIALIRWAWSSKSRDKGK